MNKLYNSFRRTSLIFLAGAILVPSPAKVGDRAETWTEGIHAVCETFDQKARRGEARSYS